MNYLGATASGRLMGGRWGAEPRPRWSDDGGVIPTSTCKAVAQDSSYHTPTPLPNPSPRPPHGAPHRTGRRGGAPSGHRRASPHGGRGHREGYPLHPRGDGGGFSGARAPTRKWATVRIVSNRGPPNAGPSRTRGSPHPGTKPKQLGSKPVRAPGRAIGLNPRSAHRR